LCTVNSTRATNIQEEDACVSLKLKGKTFNISGDKTGPMAQDLNFVLGPWKFQKTVAPLTTEILNISYALLVAVHQAILMGY
jgi:hypothetical protein